MYRVYCSVFSILCELYGLLSELLMICWCTYVEVYRIYQLMEPHAFIDKSFVVLQYQILGTPDIYDILEFSD